MKPRPPKGSTLKQLVEFYYPTDVGPSACHPWQGHIDAHGYGTVRFGGRLHYAHRISYEVANGVSIPAGTSVRHKCDNPKCVNPMHLELGSHFDNMRDKVARGRQHRGESTPGSKLTAGQVLLIQEARRAGATYQSIADEFGVHQTTVWDLVNGRTWSHMTPVS